MQRRVAVPVLLCLLFLCEHWGPSNSIPRDCYILHLEKYANQKRCRERFIETFIQSCGIYKRSIPDFEPSKLNLGVLVELIIAAYFTYEYSNCGDHIDTLT